MTRMPHTMVNRHGSVVAVQPFGGKDVASINR